MRASEALWEFLMFWEGLRRKPYRDEAGKWTVGVGHLMGPGESTTREWTDEECRGLFEADIARFARGILTMVDAPLKQHQFDALVALAFNIGLASFQKSTVLKLLNMNNAPEDIAEWFLPWCKVTVDGKLQTSNGLKRRREAERELFLDGNYYARRT